MKSKLHYDIRLVCPITGDHEATEDIGHPTLEKAQYVVREILTGHASRYVIVACDKRGSDPCHDVDLAYWVHQRVHEGHEDCTLERMVGKPQDRWIA